VGQRHLPWLWHLAAADQPHIRDGVVGGAKGPYGDARGAVAGESGDAMDAGGVNRFSQGHRRQDGGEPSRQHGCGHRRLLWHDRGRKTYMSVEVN
jgi:hypothetical protein